MAVSEPHPPEAEGLAPVAFRFAEFELRLDGGELRKAGKPVKLQPRPARVLEILVRRAGEVVSRDDIHRSVWGEETYVDFDLALNFCIRQIRGALGDSVEEPRFVATVPRRGYRFLATVEAVGHRPAAGAASRPRRRTAWGGAVILALTLAGGLIEWCLPRNRLPDLPSSPAARRAYLRAQYLQDDGQLKKALSAFEETTVLAPGFAPAYAARAQVLAQSGLPGNRVLARMEAAESRALGLDPVLPLAHLARAERLFYYLYDWPRAEAEFRRALRLDPRSAAAHQRLALFLAARGRHGEALAEIGRAEELDPRSFLVGSDAAWLYYLARRYSEAIEQARRTLDLASHGDRPARPADQTGFQWANMVILLAERERGDEPAALVAARQEARRFVAPQDEARRRAAPPLASLADFWAFRERHPVPNSWYLATTAIGLGQAGRAVELLLQGCRERSSDMIPYLRVDPLYDPLRSEPRFAALLRCANLDGR